MFFITVDARQGYHQIAVREKDREKVCFAAPDGKKYTNTVMPFGPMNEPSFYTCVMQMLKEEWDHVLQINLQDFPLLQSQLLLTQMQLSPPSMQICRSGNCPASSKFDLLHDWKLQDLLSFIRFCQFYTKFKPLIELKNKALHRLAKQFFCVLIPPSACTPDLIQLFNESNIFSSPILA